MSKGLDRWTLERRSLIDFVCQNPRWPLWEATRNIQPATSDAAHVTRLEPRIKAALVANPSSNNNRLGIGATDDTTFFWGERSPRILLGMIPRQL